MTKLLKPLGMELYIFRMNMHNGSVKSIGIGNFFNGDIDTQIQAFIIMKEVLFWKVDILTF